MDEIDLTKCLHCAAVSFCDGEPLTHQNCIARKSPKKTSGARKRQSTKVPPPDPKVLKELEYLVNEMARVFGGEDGDDKAEATEDA